MIDHVSVPVRDLEVSARFYDAVLAAIGLDPIRVKEGTVGYGKDHPEFWINSRPGMSSVDADSGLHICLRAPSPSEVQGFYDAALAAGGTDDGPPGKRPEYNDRYYAAFVRDPDGNRIEVVTFVDGA